MRCLSSVKTINNELEDNLYCQYSGHSAKDLDARMYRPLSELSGVSDKQLDKLARKRESGAILELGRRVLKNQSNVWTKEEALCKLDELASGLFIHQQHFSSIVFRFRSNCEVAAYTLILYYEELYLKSMDRKWLLYADAYFLLLTSSQYAIIGNAKERVLKWFGKYTSPFIDFYYNNCVLTSEYNFDEMYFKLKNRASTVFTYEILFYLCRYNEKEKEYKELLDYIFEDQELNKLVTRSRIITESLSESYFYAIREGFGREQKIEYADKLEVIDAKNPVTAFAKGECFYLHAEDITEKNSIQFIESQFQMAMKPNMYGFWVNRCRYYYAMLYLDTGRWRQGIIMGCSSVASYYDNFFGVLLDFEKEYSNEHAGSVFDAEELDIITDTIFNKIRETNAIHWFLVERVLRNTLARNNYQKEKKERIEKHYLLASLENCNEVSPGKIEIAKIIENYEKGSIDLESMIERVDSSSEGDTYYAFDLVLHKLVFDYKTMDSYLVAWRILDNLNEDFLCFAQYAAHMYINGLGRDRDVQKGISILKQALDDNQPGAQCYMGIAYSDTEYFFLDNDEKKSEELLIRSAFSPKYSFWREKASEILARREIERRSIYSSYNQLVGIYSINAIDIWHMDLLHWIANRILYNQYVSGTTILKYDLIKTDDYALIAHKAVKTKILNQKYIYDRAVIVKYALDNPSVILDNDERDLLKKVYDEDRKQAYRQGNIHAVFAVAEDQFKNMQFNDAINNYKRVYYKYEFTEPEVFVIQRAAQKLDEIDKDSNQSYLSSVQDKIRKRASEKQWQIEKENEEITESNIDYSVVGFDPEQIEYITTCQNKIVGFIKEENYEDAAINMRRINDLIVDVYIKKIAPEMVFGSTYEKLMILEEKKAIEEKYLTILHNIRKISNEFGAHVSYDSQVDVEKLKEALPPLGLLVRDLVIKS